jgi:hypothetical protein
MRKPSSTSEAVGDPGEGKSNDLLRHQSRTSKRVKQGTAREAKGKRKCGRKPYNRALEAEAEAAPADKRKRKKRKSGIVEADESPQAQASRIPLAEETRAPGPWVASAARMYRR